MKLRLAIVLVIVGLLAFQVVRSAAVRAVPDSSLAATLWPSHPGVRLTKMMREIGSRAARGESLPPALLSDVDRYAVQVPLAPEPYLVKGALAQLERDDARADRLFLHARALDPRSEAARYFLADRFMRIGQTSRALSEMAVLAKMVPGVSEQFAPALAVFARSPGAAAPLKEMFRSSPEFEPPVLTALASDAGNADLIMRLWSGNVAAASPPGMNWKERLVQALVDKQDYARARSIWSRLSGVQAPANGIFNPDFGDRAAPPPFNWRFLSKGGVAEPNKEGGLEVIYFGRLDAPLAEQLLRLRPGRYTLGMAVSASGSNGSNVNWTVQCLPGGSPIARLPLLAEQVGKRIAATFVVPDDGCPAQQLQLSGTAGEFPKSVEFTVSDLRLTRVPR